MAEPMSEFATKLLGDEPDAIAPDTSEIRLLAGASRGSLAHGTLAPHGVSLAIKHRVVEEVWFVVEGRGQVWRMRNALGEVVDVGPGASLSIPPGTHFQFRTIGDEPFRFIMCTMPPWPGADEAVRVPDHWPVEPKATTEALAALDPSLYRSKKTLPNENDPREIVYEATNHIPNLEWGVAFADIVESARHVHHRTRETYVHLEGPPLVVELGDDVRLLEAGDSLDIPVGVPHKARSQGPGPARVVVTTYPAWSAEEVLE
jgi:mannose-6-phosphate isomerase-like protein (cupin superfamily)